MKIARRSYHPGFHCILIHSLSTTMVTGKTTTVKPFTDDADKYRVRDDQFFVTRSNSSDANSPVVYLLGWAGSTDADLQKYSSAYEGLGFTTVRHVTPKYTVFYGHRQMPGYARNLLDHLRDNGLTGRPLFFHGFSNMGASTVQHVFNAAAEEEEDNAVDIRGVVYDSNPGRPTLSSAYHALVDHVLSGPKAWRLVQFVYHVIKIGVRAVASGGRSAPAWWDFHVNYDGRYKTVPSAFLYSDGDACIPSADVEEMAEDVAARGAKVTRVNFGDSTHVAHWDKYPEKYEEAVVKFVKESLE